MPYWSLCTTPHVSSSDARLLLTFCRTQPAASNDVALTQPGYLKGTVDQAKAESSSATI